MPKGFVLTQEEAEDRLLYWQDRLRLGDWHITIGVFRSYELNGLLGEVTWTEMRDADIRLMAGSDISPMAQSNPDMEITLVHELLHLRFANVSEHDRGSLGWRLFESGLEATAQALVALERDSNASRT